MSRQGDSDPSGDTGSPQPWWRRATFIAALLAVAVAATGGWLQQGGTSLVQSLFDEGEQPSRPLVSVESANHSICNSWLLSGPPETVASALRETLPRGTSDMVMDEQEKIAKKVLSSTGSQLSTGDLVEVTVQGKKEQTIVLTRLEVIVERKGERHGDIMFVGFGCGDGLPARRYQLDLDNPAPKFELVKEDPDSGEDVVEAVKFPYKVSSAEPEYLSLQSFTEGYAAWKAKLHWVTDGKRGFTEISDHGKPFVTFKSYPEDYSFSTDSMKLSAGQ